MWIIYFQNIQTKDYNKIKRLFLKHGIFLNNLSPMLVSKCLLEHHLLKKSWRKISNKYGIHYSKIYQKNIKIQETDLTNDLFKYFINEGILVYNGASTHSSHENTILHSLKALDALGM